VRIIAMMRALSAVGAGLLLSLISTAAAVAMPMQVGVEPPQPSVVWKPAGPSLEYRYFKSPASLGWNVQQVAVWDEPALRGVPLEALIGQALGEPVPVRAHHVEGLYLVDLPARMHSEAGARAAVAALAGQPGIGFASPALFDMYGGETYVARDLIVGIDPAVDPAAAEKFLQDFGAGTLLISDYTGPRTYLLRFPVRDGIKALELANRLADTPGVLFAEPDLLMTARYGWVPNDPSFGQSWGLRNTGQSGGTVGADMRAVPAWDITTGSPDIVVAVFDTGIELTHPDLNLAPGRNFTTGATNGVGDGAFTNTCERHGTAVAGCVAGIINNSIGTAGIAPTARAASFRIGTQSLQSPCAATFSSQTTWRINAINTTQALGYRVTNASYSTGTSSSGEQTAYTNTRSAGIVHFSSAGNSGTNTLSGPPATYSSVVAVAALNRFNARASFSQYGPGLAISAPGESILTTDLTGSAGYASGNHATVDGTSFSSPYAAGVAALVISRNPALTGAQVENILFSTARDLGPAGYDTEYGWGFIDAQQALNATAVPTCQNLWTYINPSGPSRFNGAAVTYDAPRQRAIAVGGVPITGTAPVRQTWEYDGALWTLRSSTGPSARWQTALAHHAALNRTILFGGNTGSVGGSAVAQGDTWWWNGTAGTWSQLFPATSPPARYAHAMAYDSVRARVVLHGGIVSGSVSNQTWEYDGSTWTLKSTSGPARADAVLVYDPVRQRTLLIGGRSTPGGTPSGDAWAWDGTTWVSAGTTTLGGVQVGAFVASRGQVVAVGPIETGGSGATSLRAVGWNGTAWTTIATWSATTGPVRPSTTLAASVTPLPENPFAFFEPSTRRLLTNFTHSPVLDLGALWAWTPDPPALINAGAVTAASFGGTAVLTAEFGDPANATYQWYFGGSPLSDGGRYSGTTTPTLTITNVNAADAGAYGVRIVHPCVTITQSPPQFSLTVSSPSATHLGTLNPLPSSITTSASLAPGQVRWYTFTLATPIDASTPNFTFLDIDTEGSLLTQSPPTSTDNDTMLAIYRSDGTLIAVDDDDGSNLLSQLTFGASHPARAPVGNGQPYDGRDGAFLPAGTYHLAVTGYSASAVFADGFVASSAHARSGTIQLNLRRGTGNAPPSGIVEVEPNDSKATATVAPMTPGQILTGTTTGGDSSGGLTSQDYWRINLPAQDGIRRYRLLFTDSTTGHSITLRGVNQVNGVPGTADVVVQTALNTTTPPRFLQWYTHGTVPASLYVRVSGNAGTTAPYVAVLESLEVEPSPIPGGNLAPGSITITTVGQTGGTQTDTHLLLLDTDLNPIPGARNNDTPAGPGGVPAASLGSTLTRTLAPGDYVLAISNFNLADHLPAPADDNFRSAPLLDFPGLTVNSTGSSNLNISFRITDALGSRQVSATKTGPFEVVFRSFSVGIVACGPADIAQTDSSPGPDGNVDNGDFSLFINSFFSADCSATCGIEPVTTCAPADIGQTDSSPGPDGCVDNGDFSLFISAFFSANCP
jgi:subtilisin family serine protease